MFESIALFVQIVLINIVLSGDNAVVIALASKDLAADQRKKAILWGAAGAILLRIALTVAAVFILAIPYIQAAGSLLLMWIAVKLLIEEEGDEKVKSAATLGKAIWTIIVADFVMSLDNVLAIAAKANNNFVIIILGTALSIPIIVWGSALVVKLLYRFPVFIYIGAGILGYTAGEMFVRDKKISELIAFEPLDWIIPVTMTIVVIIAGIAKKAAVRSRESSQAMQNK